MAYFDRAFEFAEKLKQKPGVQFEDVVIQLAAEGFSEMEAVAVLNRVFDYGLIHSREQLRQHPLFENRPRNTLTLWELIQKHGPDLVDAGCDLVDSDE